MKPCQNRIFQPLCHIVIQYAGRDSAVSDKYNKLNKLLPPAHETTYQLRQNRRFDIPNWSTNRFRDTFIMASAINNGC